MPIEKRYPESLIFLIIFVGYAIIFLGLLFFWSDYPNRIIWESIYLFGFSIYMSNSVIRIREEGLEIPYWVFGRRLIPWEQIKEITYHRQYLRPESVFIHYYKNQKIIHFEIPLPIIKDQDFISEIAIHANLPLPDKYLQFMEHWNNRDQTPWRIGWTVILAGLLSGLLYTYTLILPYGMNFNNILGLGVTLWFLSLFLGIRMLYWAIEQKPRIDWIMVLAICSLMIEIFILSMIAMSHSNLTVSLIPISINITVLVLFIYVLWGMNNRHPYPLGIAIAIILMVILIGIPVSIIPQAKSQLVFKTKYSGRLAINPANDLIFNDRSLDRYPLSLYNVSERKWTTYLNQDDSHNPSLWWHHITSWNKQGDKALIISATYRNESTHTIRKEFGAYDKKTNQITLLYQIDIPNELGRRNENIELKGEWNSQGNQLIYWEPVIFYPDLRVEYRLVLYNPANNTRQGILQSPLNPYKTIWKDDQTLLILTSEPDKPRRVYGGNYYKLWKLALPPSGTINSKTIKTQLLYSIDTPDYNLMISPANNLIMIQSINSKNMEASPFNKLWD